MNYFEYDRIQAELGGIGDGFKSNIHRIIALSDASAETVELVEKVCDQVSVSLNELSVIVSQIAALISDRQ